MMKSNTYLYNSCMDTYSPNSKCHSCHGHYTYIDFRKNNSFYFYTLFSSPPPRKKKVFHIFISLKKNYIYCISVVGEKCKKKKKKINNDSTDDIKIFSNSRSDANADTVRERQRKRAKTKKMCTN